MIRALYVISMVVFVVAGLAAWWQGMPLAALVCGGGAVFAAVCAFAPGLYK